MNVSRLTVPVLVVLASLFLAPMAHGADKVLSKGTMDGVFLRVDQGDYVHFVLKDTAGREQDFFIIKTDGTVDAFVKAPDKYKGRKVRIKWQKVMSNIPEAGGPIEVRQITSVTLR